jgi:DNA-binding NarL/FixJ family response regulator
VAVLDYRLPDGDGVIAATALRSVSPQTQVLLLTELDNSHLVTSAIEAGYAGFITKDQAVRELVSAVQGVFAGEAYFSPEVLTALLPRIASSTRALGSDLTVRQHEVLCLLAAGIGNKEIAVHLGLSLNTVRNYVQNVLVKLGAHSKLEAVAIATREDLVDRSA